MKHNNISSHYAFLFDLDGTLVISDDIYFHIWSTILKKYNLYLTFDLFNKHIQGKSDKDVIKYFIPSLHNNNKDNKDSCHEISELKDMLFIENIDKIKIVSGCIEFIEKIKMLGHKVCIVTNCNRNVAEQILKKINLQNEICIIGNECSEPKPSPEPYFEAMRRLNADKEECIIFEDSRDGIKSAMQANSKCVCGIETSFNKNELLNMGCKTTIQNYLYLEITQFTTYENNDFNLKKLIAYTLNTSEKQIEIDEVKLKGGFISDIIKFKCNGENYVVKLENKNESFMTKVANDLKLYDREYYFYEVISKHVAINIPKFYGIVKDDKLKSIGIIMEDLYELKYKINLDLNNDIDTAMRCISDCSKMHAKFWNKNMSNIFPLLKKHNDELYNPSWQIFVKDRWNLFKNKWSTCLSERQLKIGENIVNNFQKIQNNLSDKNLTLCHGDVKSPNIFYNTSGPCIIPYFIDWQYIANGKGIQDIIFFIIESFETKQVVQLYPIFINYYYQKILEQGINYLKNDYENDIINSICYFPFYVAVWFGTTAEQDLIDKNFPFFFINKLFSFIDKFVPSDYIF